MEEIRIDNVMMLSVDRTSIGDRQSNWELVLNKADDPNQIENKTADDSFSLEVAHSLTKVGQVLGVHEQLEALAQQIREKDQQMQIMSQQLAETQRELQTTTLERDSLKSKTSTYYTLMKSSLEQLKDVDSVNILDDPSVLGQQTTSHDEESVVQTCSKMLMDQPIKPVRRTRGPGRKKKQNNPVATPALRLLIPRPNTEGGEYAELQIAGCSQTNNSNININENLIKMCGVGNVLGQMKEIYQPPIDSRAVTVYKVVEGLKEFETVLEVPYPNCHMPECGIALNTPREIETHYKQAHNFSTIISVNGKKKKSCDECVKSFLNVADLKLHKKWHHPVVVDEDARKAAIQNIAVLDQFGQPLLPIDGPPPQSGALIIDVIPRPMDTDVSRLVSTQSSTAPVPRKFQCYYCETKFSVKEFCEAHIRQKHFRIARPFYCKICGRSLASRKAFQSHIDVHSNTRNSNHFCEICGRNFASVTNLRRHMFLHSNERPHLCSICGLSFTQKGSLDNHMRTHGYRDALLCAYCCRGYKSLSKLKEHIEAKHRDGQTYACCICNLEVEDAASLQQHFQLHKTIGREKPFGCHLCTFSSYFTRDLSCHLEAHKRGVSRTEKNRRSCQSRQTVGPFICKFCGKRCVGKDYLDLHEVKHTGVKKFKCDECGRKFTMQPLLKRHVETKHNGIRYPCRICGKEFTEPGNIKRHISEVHHKTRAFSCAVCQRDFSQKASLRVHLNTTAHRDRLYRQAEAQEQEVVSDEIGITESVMEQLVFGDGMNHMVIHHQTI